MKNLGNVMIFGDSYSTFTGFVPKGYAVYYNSDNVANGVSSVELTWWHQLIKRTDSNLVLNDSWSGSTVCYTGYNGYCRENSFIGRMEKYDESGFFNKTDIDTFLIFGGTNDTWANAPIGSPIYSDWADEDLKSALPGLCYLIARLKEIKENARITVIINTELKPEITNGYETICKEYGIQYILLENIDKENGHPTAQGMEQIANQIEAVIE